jgi:hypothetical protein
MNQSAANRGKPQQMEAKPQHTAANRSKSEQIRANRSKSEQIRAKVSQKWAKEKHYLSAR